MWYILQGPNETTTQLPLNTEELKSPFVWDMTPCLCTNLFLRCEWKFSFETGEPITRRHDVIYRNNGVLGLTTVWSWRLANLWLPLLINLCKIHVSCDLRSRAHICIYNRNTGGLVSVFLSSHPVWLSFSFVMHLSASNHSKTSARIFMKL